MELVDLGLSVKWTKYNLDATHGDTPESWYGNYYAWGETDVKSGYNGNNYKYGSYTWNAGGNEWITNTLSKYNTQSQYGETDNKTLLEESDDVAYSQGLRTPTFSEIMELLDNTKIKKEWKANYSGVTNLNGALFTSLVAGFEGNSVFIPAAAVKNDNGTSFVGIGGHIRSSQINESDPGFARIIIFGYSEGQFFTVDDIDERCLGVPVRGVSE